MEAKSKYICAPSTFIYRRAGFEERRVIKIFMQEDGIKFGKTHIPVCIAQRRRTGSASEWTMIWKAKDRVQWTPSPADTAPGALARGRLRGVQVVN